MKEGTFENAGIKDETILWSEPVVIINGFKSMHDLIPWKTLPVDFHQVSLLCAAFKTQCNCVRTAIKWFSLVYPKGLQSNRRKRFKVRISTIVFTWRQRKHFLRFADINNWINNDQLLHSEGQALLWEGVCLLCVCVCAHMCKESTYSMNIPSGYVT